MINQFVMTGRFAKLIKSNNDEYELVLQCMNNDTDDTYNLSFILSSKAMIENVKYFCKVNDSIGVKGKIISHRKLLADRVTFLSSCKNN